MFKNELETIFYASKVIYLPRNGMKDELISTAAKRGIKNTSKGKKIPTAFMILDELLKRTKQTPTIFEGFDPVPPSEEKIGFEIGVEQWANLLPSSPTIVSDAKKILFELDWIKHTQNYQEGRKCYHYSLTSTFFGRSPALRGCDRKHAYVIKDAKRTARFKVLGDISLSPEVFEIFDQVAKKRSWKESEKLAQKKQLQDFSFNKNRFHQNREGGRVTTEISSLPTPFRQFLKIDSEDTVEIDIKSAHPLCIAHTDEFKTHPQEREQWIKFVSEQDIYLHLLNLAKEHGARFDQSLEPDDLRDGFKGIMSAFLNGGGKNAFDENLELEIDFKPIMLDEFPTLSIVIKELIENHSDPSPEGTPRHKQSRNGAALRMQQIESEIMGTWWMCEDSTFECVSIHDGVLCKESEADDLIRAVKERAEKILGFEIVVERK